MMLLIAVLSFAVGVVGGAAGLAVAAYVTSPPDPVRLVKVRPFDPEPN
jgi:hypothetical protein